MDGRVQQCGTRECDAVGLGYGTAVGQFHGEPFCRKYRDGGGDRLGVEDILGCGEEGQL